MTTKKKWILTLVVALIVGCATTFLINRARTPYNYDLDKYVKVGKYKGLEYQKTNVTITDKEVDQEIQNRLQKKTKIKSVKEGVAEDGDILNIAYEGKIDGKKFEGGSTESQDIEIGKSQMIDGFIDGIKGKKVGETFVLNLKFPDDYANKDVAGKPVEFKITINSKKIKDVPKLDDEFVKKDSKEKNVKDYKAYIKKTMRDRKQEMADSSIKGVLWNQIMSSSKVKKYPEKEMKEAKKEAEKWAEDYKKRAESYGMKWEDFLKNSMRTDKKGFEKMKEEYAKNLVFNEMVMYKIAREENIKLSKSEYKEKIHKIVKDAGYNEKTFKKAFNMDIEEYAKKNNWEKSMLLDKVMDKVMKYGKAKKPLPKKDAASKEEKPDEATAN